MGERPDARMRRVASERGFEYDGRARQFRPEDLDRFDLIVAMDASNRSHLLSMARTREQRAKIRMLREFDPQGGKNAAVPDPYYGGVDGFERTYDIVERSTQKLLETLEAGELS